MEPIKDEPTVTPEGVPIKPRIHGLVVRPAVHLADHRGDLTEVYNPAWGVSEEPLVFVYQVTVLPGRGRGWVVHAKQDDRIYHCLGRMLWAFYDNRPESPTYRMLNKITLTSYNRSLLITPCGVYHACMNIGHEEAVFFNMPTQPYNHTDPDKYRLPLKNDLIPYDFSDTQFLKGL